MSVPNTVPGSPTGATGPQRGRQRDLVDALRSERRQLDELYGALQRQRRAVAEEDIEGVEAAVRDVQRILLTLGEALRRRRSLITLITGTEDSDLEALVASVGASSSELRDTALGLIHAARVVSGELQTTRILLQGAIEMGDRHLKTISGAEDPESLYRPADDPRTQRHRALLVDRQV